MSFAVLYVDDDADLREIAAFSLEIDPGIVVRTCSSGAQALETLRDWKPDIVLLDMMMPGMDGPATHAAIRAEHGAIPPVVYITARGDQSALDSLGASGALGVIAKPFDPMALAQQVRAFIDRG